MAKCTCPYENPEEGDECEFCWIQYMDELAQAQWGVMGQGD